jgi:GT2 family glycosyltransferase
MTITAIIPTYKRPKLLEETVRSVWGQSRLPEEILIGDDSPGKETETLVKEVLAPASPVPIRYWHNRPSLGEARNVDLLYREAQGEAILHLHDDDPIYPDCVRLLAAPLEADGEVVASFGLQHLIEESGDLLPDAAEVNRAFWRTPDRAGRVEGWLAGAISMFPNNGFLVRTAEANAIGYDDQGKAGYARDFYFGFRLGRIRRPFFFVPEFTAKCRMTAAAESRSNPAADNAYQTMKILLAGLSEKELAAPEVQETLRRWAPLAITTAARKGERGLALRWLFSPHYRHAIASPRWWWRLIQSLSAKHPCVMLRESGRQPTDVR